MDEMVFIDMHREKLVQAAEKWRLIKLAQAAAREAHPARRDRILNWIGNRLIVSGTLLRERYGTEKKTEFPERCVETGNCPPVM